MSVQYPGSLPFFSRLPLLGVLADKLGDALLFADSLRLELEREGFVTLVLRQENPVTGQELHKLYAHCLEYDAILVAGTGPFPFNMAVVSGVPRRGVLTSAGVIHRQFGSKGKGREQLVKEITGWFYDQWLSMPVKGCMLVGGKSRRMGTAKHLIRDQGATWAERTVNTLLKKVDEVVVSGAGELPESLQSFDRVKDVEGAAGPLAGILSVMRARPMVSWLVAACDLPDMNESALQWILSNRKPGVRGILPDLDGNGRVEPLLAYYDFRCKGSLEELALSGSMRINRITAAPGVVTPQPPSSLKGCWRNVNTLRELMAKR